VCLPQIVFPPFLKKVQPDLADNLELTGPYHTKSGHGALGLRTRKGRGENVLAVGALWGVLLTHRTRLALQAVCLPQIVLWPFHKDPSPDLAENL
jgi:hypothetical protein